MIESVSGTRDGLLLSDEHYGHDVVGGHFHLSGGGLHVYLTGDLLHPPMVDSYRIWQDGRLWAAGAERHTEAIGDLAELHPGESVLDIGGGIGGPARLLARRHGVSVTSVTNSASHAATSRRLHEQAADVRDRLTVVLGDCQEALPPGPFDAAISVNMLYQVADHRGLYKRVFDSLAPDGRFVIDDWMLTPIVEDADLRALAEHFTYTEFGRTDTVTAELEAAGFGVERVVDLGHVGRGPMAEHFERQMREHFAPRVIADWPGDPDTRPGRPAYGKQMIEEFIAAVNVTIGLYRRRAMTYRRVLARKPLVAPGAKR